jgi:hypothetical protein
VARGGPPSEFTQYARFRLRIWDDSSLRCSLVGGRHSRALGWSHRTISRRVGTRLKSVSIPQRMALLAGIVIVSTLVTGGIFLLGGGPKRAAAPPEMPQSTQTARRSPTSHAMVLDSTTERSAPPPSTPTASATPTGATIGPQPSARSCPPGLKKRLCKHGPRG